MYQHHDMQHVEGSDDKLTELMKLPQVWRGYWADRKAVFRIFDLQKRPESAELLLNDLKINACLKELQVCPLLSQT